MWDKNELSENWRKNAMDDNEVLPVLRFIPLELSSGNSDSQDILCLQCDLSRSLPEQKDDYLAHLFLDHRLVIADVDDIACLPDYLQVWKKEFEEHELEEYCTTMLLDQLPDGTPAKNEKYYLLSDILPKDFELRKNLQHQRLQKTLERHQFELTDRSFNKECLYCRDVITGLRADYLAHLFNKHFLQLGKPENLVFVDELLAKVQRNLEHLVCLYCEKVFKDRITLKDHMRKKAHKRINPKNREYDKYFLINYRNEKIRHTGKHKSNLQKQRTSEGRESVDFERQFANDRTDIDSDWSDWDGGEAIPLICLFCTCKENALPALKQHMLEKHKVDFDEGLKDLNFYEKIKVINYVRRQICLVRCVSCNNSFDNAHLLLEHMATEEHFCLGTQRQWDRPEFFFPTYEDDGLLCVLDDNPNDNVDDTVVRIISEDTVAQINKDAERLSLENFHFL